MAGYIVDGVQLTQEQAERIAAEVDRRRIGPQPVMGRVYRASTSGAPVYLWKIEADGDWYSEDGGETWRGGSIDIAHCVREGKLVPYVPPAAKRIEIRDWLIVRGKNAGTVWQWRQHRQHWRCLSDDELKPALQLWALDTDHYTVLDSYTIEGAK